ncbi:MAG: hypothetical protein SGCHY_003397 [Lobulomycetales sp.]
MRALTRLERETSAADSDSDEATVPQSRVVPANAASPQQDSSEEIREAMSELKVQTSQEKGRASESTRRHPYNKIDVGWSMRCMDLLFKASFSDFITDERNVECAANHLLPIIKDYKLRQVAQGVEWMCRGWKPENAAKLLRILFADWLPDLAGVVFSMVSMEWNFSQGTSLCAAFLLMRESPENAAKFMSAWAVTRRRQRGDKEHALMVTELISYLDAVLEWGSDYFEEFTNAFFRSYKEVTTAMLATSIPKLHSSGQYTPAEIQEMEAKDKTRDRMDLATMLASLSKFYESSLAASYKLRQALKNYQASSTEGGVQVKPQILDIVGLNVNENER